MEAEYLYEPLGNPGQLTAEASAPLMPSRDVLPRRSSVHALMATIRPRQWVKNGLVVAAAGAAGALGHDHVPERVFLACLAFCLLASGIYAINDVRDAEEDRRHPRKRYRPVAAGELSPTAAVGLGIGLTLSGLAVCALVRPLLVLVGGAYLLLTVSYTLLWRQVVVLDVIAVAGGFLLRAVAGGVAAPVALSRWFLLVVSAAAVLIAAGKRHAELRRAHAEPAMRRRVLDSYPRWLLRAIIVGSAAIALTAYCIWAFKAATTLGIPWRPLTILPFAASLVRYGTLLRAGAGEAPEELALTDRPLQLAAFGWLVLFALSVEASAS